jgi:hypothetical protein
MDRTIWYFINSDDQHKKIYVVGIESAINTVAFMSLHDRTKWFVRNIEKKILKKVCDCLELFPVQAAPSAAKVVPVPVPKEGSNTEWKKFAADPGQVTPKPFSSDTTNADAAAPTLVRAVPKQDEAAHSKYYQRKHKRVNGKLRVLVFVDKKVFRTHTKNLSIGGLYLEKALPEELVGQRCRVVIGSTTNQLNIEFTAELRELRKDGTRIVFAGNQATDSLGHLQTWIDSMDVPAAFNRIENVRRAA